jgi:uncharacterized protein YndB with AHSA1/START domain
VFLKKQSRIALLKMESNRSTRVSRYINAPRSKVYNALIDAEAIAKWKFPTGMTCKVHLFDGREGGTFRISLTYDDPAGEGKTAQNTDTYHGRFVKLIPNELVVEEDEFETDNPLMQGVMTSTISLKDFEDGTEITGLHEGLPAGVALADNEQGWQLAFANLAALVETK